MHSAMRVIGLSRLVGVSLLLAACAGPETPRPQASTPSTTPQATTAMAAPAEAALPPTVPTPVVPAPSAIAPTEAPPAPAVSAAQAAPDLASAAPKATPAAKAPAKVPAPPVQAAAPPSKPGPAAQAAKPAAPTLDLTSLEQRLKDTKAIGVLTKLTLKNQVDDLLHQFRAYYQGKLKTDLAQLRQSYDLLVLKVIALLQDGDKPLATAVVASREEIWGILSDPAKFATI